MQAKHSYNSLNFQNAMFCILSSISILCQNNVVNKLFQGNFCDPTLDINNVCRVISRITKVALLNNFLSER